MSGDIDQLENWPAGRRALLDQHPRATWGDNAPATAQLWLEVHAAYRRQCATLQAAIDAYRSGKATTQQLAARASAELPVLIAHLHGHHQIEDFHYFPLFRSLEPRLAAGFDALAQHHEQLQDAIATATRDLRSFMAVAHAGTACDPALERQAAARYAAASERLCDRLLRHFEDEEDLVIPLLIEHAAEL